MFQVVVLVVASCQLQQVNDAPSDLCRASGAPRSECAIAYNVLVTYVMLDEESFIINFCKKALLK
ncbi:hypothetical protein RR46_12269 [Papilio xuthus]|uniref:Saposin B-type domain-containing protein n=1 Tax=Papilio xuthus TaxID=66420 RepID=A0A194PU05_PAPXU|nr:hypothetical protein RR46_12269 [Papilio xuthus]